MIKTPPSTDKFRSGYDEILWSHDYPVKYGNITVYDLPVHKAFRVKDKSGIIKTTEGDIVL